MDGTDRVDGTDQVDGTDHNESAPAERAMVRHWRERPRFRRATSAALWLGCVVVSVPWLGWQAVVLWGVLLVHELGHMLADRRLTAPLWVPGVGAVIVDPPKRPLTALAGALACLPIVIIISPFAPEAAMVCCAFHIVALAPIPPLDGGWVVGRGWWSYAAAAVVLITFGPIAAAAAVSLVFRVEERIDRSALALVGWGVLWAAWWAAGLWAPWR